MRSKSGIIKFILYTRIFIPIIIFILELSFLFINKSNSKITNGTKFDSLTGWRENCENKHINPENYKFLICDRNGFIKTPFEHENKKKIHMEFCFLVIVWLWEKVFMDLIIRKLLLVS